MIGIINYGIGNIGSLKNAIRSISVPVMDSNDSAELSQCSGLILPGVGAFGAAMAKLNALDLSDFIRRWSLNNKPLLGICLGMQLLLTSSEENGQHQGLDIISGKVVAIPPAPRTIHIGWNQVQPQKENKLIDNNGYAYFVHSFSCLPENENTISSTVHYGDTIIASIMKDQTYGVQFHPEKSQHYGLEILTRFTHGLI
jgi:glutamine amidotransferase